MITNMKMLQNQKQKEKLKHGSPAPPIFGALGFKNNSPKSEQRSQKPPRPVAPKPSPVLKTQKPKPKIQKPQSDEEFWQIMDDLGWEDGPEFAATAKKKGQELLKNYDKQALTSYLTKYMGELKSKFETAAVFTQLNIRDARKQNAILSHIVARGQIYYVTMMEEPMMVIAISDGGYHPLIF